MFEYRKGDIFSEAENVDALVNTVNCVGVMGRGVALQFKNAFPLNFQKYERACKKGEVRPGYMFVVDMKTDQLPLPGPKYIINFPTKRDWRNKSRMADIEAGLRDLRCVIEKKNIGSIAIPPLGSGLGGLEWEKVRPKIEEALRDLDDLRIVIFEPHEAPEYTPMVKSRQAPRMTPGRAALLGLMDRYIRTLLDPFITLLEVHKLMYFMKESGEESLKTLRISKARYGPYAENLTHVLREIEGHFISGYEDGGDAPDKELEVMPEAVEKAMKFLDDHPDTRARFDRVADLVSGFESSFGLELLSTVHWTIKNERRLIRMDDLVARVYAWNERKKQFSPRQIALAVGVLKEKGWIEPGVVLDGG